jgi:hypothetical protein
MQAIVQKNIALVEQLAKQVLELPQNEREAAIMRARQSFQEAGKADGIPEVVMEQYVNGSIAALQQAVKEIGRSGQSPNAS